MRKLLIVPSLMVLLGATCLAADTVGPNLVANPGFEAVAANGLPQGWGGDPKVYQDVTSPVHGGHHALQFVNNDPKHYTLCGSPIRLVPGKMYQVSVWVKTEDVKGADSGATICLEWSGAGGKYLGGHYPPGIKGTHDWTLLQSISPRVPAKAKSCTVTCYLRRGMSGKAWWDDVQVCQWREPPLSTMLTEPNYRGLITPETKEIAVEADLALDDYDLKPGQVQLHASLMRLPNMKVVEQQTVTPTGSRARITLPVKGLAQGQYQVITTLRQRGNAHPLGSSSWNVQVPNPAELAKRPEYIDRYNRLIVAGKPFFPLGMYWGSINEADLRLYSDSAFNCLMPYGMPTKAQMDLAQKYGEKVIYTLKDIYHGTRYAPKSIRTTADEHSFITQRVKEFRNHPALLAWYLNDELPVQYIPRLEQHQQWLEQLDPGHPTWEVLYEVGQLDMYRRTFDVLGTDPYPIPRQPASKAGEYTEMSVASVDNSRPIWMVPQVMNWAVYRQTAAEKKGLRPPTLAEMRSMAWQCIVQGAKGLVFYSFSDLKRDKMAPFAEQWPKVKQMAAEIKTMEPVILSVEPAPKVTAAGQDWLNFTTRKVGNTVYLIAVSSDGQPHSASFSLPAAPKSITATEGQLNGRVTGNRLQAAFKPFELRIFKLTF